MPPNPAELLDNGRIKELINEAKEDYDYVLLDCPPVNIVVDTQIVGQYADRTLLWFVPDCWIRMRSENLMSSMKKNDLRI